MIAELEQLKKLLWEEWDPIGVNDLFESQDEYDAYAFRIFVMLNEGKRRSDILSYLDGLEQEYIGVGKSGKAQMIVDRIFQIHENEK